MFEFLFDPSAWAALVTLTVLEIVLGIDNIILIAILADKLPEKQRPKARKIGLAAALVTRILLLSLVFMIAHIMVPLFTLFGHEYTIRDLILIMGGLFLLAKGTAEIHEKIEGEGLEEKANKQKYLKGYYKQNREQIRSQQREYNQRPHVKARKKIQNQLTFYHNRKN